MMIQQPAPTTSRVCGYRTRNIRRQRRPYGICSPGHIATARWPSSRQVSKGGEVAALRWLHSASSTRGTRRRERLPGSPPGTKLQSAGVEYTVRTLSIENSACPGASRVTSGYTVSMRRKGERAAGGGALDAEVGRARARIHLREPLAAQRGGGEHVGGADLGAQEEGRGGERAPMYICFGYARVYQFGVRKRSARHPVASEVRVLSFFGWPFETPVYPCTRPSRVCFDQKDLILTRSDRFLAGLMLVGSPTYY